MDNRAVQQQVLAQVAECSGVYGARALAERLGVSADAVERAVNKLKLHGHIQIIRTRLHITDDGTLLATRGASAKQDPPRRPTPTERDRANRDRRAAARKAKEQQTDERIGQLVAYVDLHPCRGPAFYNAHFGWGHAITVSLLGRACKLGLLRRLRQAGQTVYAPKDYEPPTEDAPAPGPRTPLPIRHKQLRDQRDAALLDSVTTHPGKSSAVHKHLLDWSTSTFVGSSKRLRDRGAIHLRGWGGGAAWYPGPKPDDDCDNGEDGTNQVPDPTPSATTTAKSPGSTKVGDTDADGIGDNDDDCNKPAAANSTPGPVAEPVQVGQPAPTRVHSEPVICGGCGAERRLLHRPGRPSQMVGECRPGCPQTAPAPPPADTAPKAPGPVAAPQRPPAPRDDLLFHQEITARRAEAIAAQLADAIRDYAHHRAAADAAWGRVQALRRAEHEIAEELLDLPPG